MAELIINALVEEFGVNLGDHGETKTTAVVIDPDETIAAVVERLLTRQEHAFTYAADDVTIVPDTSKSLIIRLAE